MANELSAGRDFSLGRRQFTTLGAGSVAAVVGGSGMTHAAEAGASRIVTPPEGKRILLACELG